MSLADKIKADAARNVPSDKEISEVRGLMRELRDLEAERAQLEERMRQVGTRIGALTFTELPEAFVERGMRGFILEAEGNHPAVEAKMMPYHKAVISADWPEEKRNEAFTYLTDLGHGDLIRTEVVASFARHDRAKALETAAALRNAGIDVDVQSNIHWGTLTSWLREQVEKGTIPDLEKIGGVVGRIVKIKPLAE